MLDLILSLLELLSGTPEPVLVLGIPILIAAAGAALSAALSGAALSAIVASTLIAAGAAAFSSIFGSKKKPNTPRASFSAKAQERTQTIRGGVDARKIPYGYVTLSGAPVLAETTDANENLHYILPIADTQAEIDEVRFNDDRVGPRDGSGDVTDGRFEDHLRLKLHTGTLAQAADADAVSGVGIWSTAHRGRGVAYLYARLKRSNDVYPTGIPNIKARVKGRRMLDPRDAGVTILTSDLSAEAVFTTDGAHGLVAGDPVWIRDHISSVPTVAREYEVATAPTTTTLTLLDRADGEPVALSIAGTGGSIYLMKFSSNWALCVRDWLASEWGFDLPDVVLPDDIYIAAANAADEDVALTGTETDSFSADAGGVLTRSDKNARFWTGDRVRVAGGGLPSPLLAATDYYYIVDDGDYIADAAKSRFKLATSIANAEAGTGITIAGAGSGTLSREGQRRYTADGVIEWDGPPLEHLTDMLTAGAGTVDYTGGMYRLLAGVDMADTFALTQADFLGKFNYKPEHGLRDRWNAVSAQYVDPFEDWQPVEAPLRTNALFESEDGVRIKRDLELSFTIDRVRAQRLSEVDLRASRQSGRFIGTVKSKSIQVAVMDRGTLTLPDFGFASKRFVITKFGKGFPGPVRLTGKETAAEIWDWDAGDELTRDLTPNTTLPDPTVVTNPTGLALVTVEHVQETGGSIYRLSPSWTAAADAFVTAGGQYEIQWKESAAATWRPSFFVAGDLEAVDVPDPVQFGVNHDLRIRSINSLGVKATTWQSLFGYTVGSSGAGATAQYDDGLITEIATVPIDMGSIAATPTLTLDDGAIT